MSHLSNVEVSLQDPIGRASGLTVLNGLLGDLLATMPLGSQLGDEPTGVCDSSYAEATHPGSENGWARLTDSIPVRSAEDLPRSTAGAQDQDVKRTRREPCVEMCKRNP